MSFVTIFYGISFYVATLILFIGLGYRIYEYSIIPSPLKIPIAFSYSCVPLIKKQVARLPTSCSASVLDPSSNSPTPPLVAVGRLPSPNPISLHLSPLAISQPSRRHGIQKLFVPSAQHRPMRPCLNKWY